MSDDVRKLIERLAPNPVCDDCIAGKLTLPVQDVRLATQELAGASQFERRRDSCSLCDGETLTIRRL